MIVGHEIQYLFPIVRSSSVYTLYIVCIFLHFCKHWPVTVNIQSTDFPGRQKSDALDKLASLRAQSVCKSAISEFHKCFKIHYRQFTTILYNIYSLMKVLGNCSQFFEMDGSTSTTVYSKFKDNAVFGYGTSLPPNNNDSDEPGSSGKKVIFCVHGKLSGCCTIVKSSPTENNAIPEYQRSPSFLEDHCHRERNEKIDKKARRKLIIASILCVLFMIGEIIGGVLSSSLAIATDAAHLLTDFASFMISLFSIWVASRPATRKMPFGWYRAEVIGALTSVLMIWVVTGILIYMAVQRLIHKDFEINSTVMLITSAIGVAVNLVMGLTLHQHGHSHGGASAKEHGHGHGHKSVENGGAHGHSHEVNINVRAALIHVIGDFIQSLGVFVAAIVIYYKPEWSIVDPICTFFFSALVLVTTMAIMKDTINVLMEGIPAGLDYSQVENTFMEIEGVLKVHNLRIWALSLDKTALSAHLVIAPGKSPQEILRTATRNIHDMYSFFEMTLQIEEFNQKMENCHQCKSPPM